jgi:hypothetical protein
MPDLKIRADSSQRGSFKATAKVSGSMFATPEPINRVPRPAGSAARIVEPAGPFSSTIMVERTRHNSAEHGTCALCWTGTGPLAGSVGLDTAKPAEARAICSRCLVTLEMLAAQFGCQVRLQIETPA